MALFAISDLHLPAREKPMDVFGAHWENHFERIREDWLQRVGAEDVVLLPGDLTWAMRLEDAMEDIAARSAEEADRRIDARIGRIEPVMVAVLSLIVGLVLLSVMLPLIGVLGAIG